MKFLLLAPSLEKGGSERFISNLSLLLSKEHQVTVAIFDNDVDYPVGGTLYDMKTPVKKGVVKRILTFFERCVKFKKLVKKLRPDVILSVMDSANRVNTTCKIKGVKQFISCRGFADLLRTPEAFIKGAARTSGVIFNSKEAREYFCKNYGGPLDKSFYNYNLIDFDKISENIEEPVNDPELEKFLKNHRCIVNVGRLAKVKCQVSLIKAFEILQKKVPDAGLVIVGGNGNYVEEVRKAAKESPSREHIFMAGNRDNPHNIMAKCYAYALSSETEGFPNALVEAMVSGLPVVSADCMTGPGEILRKEICDEKVSDVTVSDYGILTPLIEGNEEKFANALELLMSDKALYNSMKDAAGLRAECFSPGQAMKDFMEIVRG